jgi:MFS family permease
MTPRAAITTVFAVSGAAFGTWAARIPAVQDRLDLSAGRLGLALGAVAAGALVAMPLAGREASRRGSATAVRVFLVLLVVALPLPFLAPGLGWLMAAAFLFGAANGGLDVVMNAHGVAVERALGRPILSSLHASFSIGGFAAAGLGAAAAAADVDARVNAAVVAVVIAAAGAWAQRSLLPAGADREPPAAERPARREGPRLPRALWALGAAAFCCLFAEGAAADWSAVYVTDALGAAAATGAVAFAAFSLAMTTGRLVGDRLTERHGAVALVRRGALLAAAGVLGALVAGAPAAAVAGFACLGAGLAVIVPSVFRAAAAVPGIAPGPALATVTTVGYTGFLAGPPVIGGLAELTSLPAALGLIVLATAALASLAPKVAT